MGLAGQHTQAMTEWNTFEIHDQFDKNPVQSGFIASGIAQPVLWNVGPAVPPTQCSGVTFVAQSGQVFGGALLAGPASIGAEATASTRENFTMTSGGSLYARARFFPQEITSGALAMGFGFFSAPLQSGIMNAAGGAVRASGDFVGVVKFSGQGNWALAANVQTSGLSVAAGNTTAGGTQSGMPVDVELFINPDRQSVEITGKVNGIYMKANVTDPLPIVLKFPVDATPMAIGFVSRPGASEADGILVDKVLAQQAHNYP